MGNKAGFFLASRLALPKGRILTQSGVKQQGLLTAAPDFMPAGK